MALNHFTWPAGRGPSFITVPSRGTIIDITSYDDEWTVPPANIHTITLEYAPVAPQLGDQQVIFTGHDGASLIADYPTQGRATYTLPRGITRMTHLFTPRNESPNIPVHFTFPYEGGRTVSFTLDHPTIALGIGGLFVTGATVIGDIPGVHYFADPKDHSNVYFHGSPDVGSGEIEARGLWGATVNPPTFGLSGFATPYDPGFGIGDYQRNKAAFQRKYITFTAQIAIEEPAEYFSKHPNDYLVPLRQVPIPGYFELLIGSTTITELSAVRYQNPKVPNQITGTPPPASSTTLTAQIGDQRGFFTGRTRT